MSHSRNYPATVAEVLSDRRKYNPAALAAVRAFRRSKPWRGSIPERFDKFQHLNAALAAAYGIRAPRLEFTFADRESANGNGVYSPREHAITLIGKLSVVTYLHEFAHARGADERQACAWSINLFRRMFPRSYAGCRHVGHCLVRN